MSEERIREQDWVPVTDPMFEKDADTISDILDAAGIPAKVADLNRPNYRYFGPPVEMAQVVVPKQHLEEARALLDAKEKEAESN